MLSGFRLRETEGRLWVIRVRFTRSGGSWGTKRWNYEVRFSIYNVLENYSQNYFIVHSMRRREGKKKTNWWIEQCSIFRDPPLLMNSVALINFCLWWSPTTTHRTNNGNKTSKYLWILVWLNDQHLNPELYKHGRSASAHLIYNLKIISTFSSWMDAFLKIRWCATRSSYQTSWYNFICLCSRHLVR